MSHPDHVDARLAARLAARVKHLRGSRSQRSVASVGGGVKISALRAIENEEIEKPSLRVVLEIAKSLGVTVEELLGPVPSKQFLDDLRSEGAKGT